MSHTYGECEHRLCRAHKKVSDRVARMLYNRALFVCARLNHDVPDIIKIRRRLDVTSRRRQVVGEGETRTVKHAVSQIMEQYTHFSVSRICG